MGGVGGDLGVRGWGLGGRVQRVGVDLSGAAVCWEVVFSNVAQLVKVDVGEPDICCVMFLDKKYQSQRLRPMFLCPCFGFLARNTVHSGTPAP